VHAIAFADSHAKKHGDDEADGHGGEDDDFGVHLLKSGKLKEEGGNKINHEIHEISRKV
jgi:hypothetical protein